MNSAGIPMTLKSCFSFSFEIDLWRLYDWLANWSIDWLLLTSVVHDVDIIQLLAQNSPPPQLHAAVRLQIPRLYTVKAKLHYAIQVADLVADWSATWIA